MGPRDYEDRIEEYEDGYDSRESFERADCDREEDLVDDDDDDRDR
jgi:hypothetical protein